ncbi:MAG: hemin receptor, partial [Prevotella sp.]|nr:hemin receptor [Prevotella sp.]
MKKYLMIAAWAFAAMPVMAQDTYEGARLLGSDLNGTARYVGMGGAMEALGADISTISTNPAGIGLFRKSTASLSFGLVSQQDVQKFDGLNKTKMSFDQLGFVYSSRISSGSFINFAFNYHKSKNFNQILSAANRLNGQSLNGLTYRKAEIGNVSGGGYDLDFNKDGELMGWENSTSETSEYRAQTYSQLDYINANVLLLDANYKELMKNNESYIFDMGADEFSFDRAHRGWINDFDINISGNSNDRFYWGVTVGVHDVNYKGYSEYSEGFVSTSGEDLGYANYGDERKIKGSGFDITAGVILRPVMESPFRVGFSVKTPTWYDLTSENFTMAYNHSKYGAWKYGKSGESYDFKLYTPWKFGLSLGHTIGNYLALGASYEYSDYGALSNRVNDGYDYYGNEYS